MTHVKTFSTLGVGCDWNPRKGWLEFSNGVRIVCNAAWSPGMPGVEPGALPPRFWYVERTKREKTFGVRLTGDGNLGDGAYQGGTDIELDPIGKPYSHDILLAADRTMQRHAVAALDWHTGEPLHPDVFGNEEYALDQDVPGNWDEERISQLRPFSRPVKASHPQANWHKIAASHLPRATWRLAAAWHNERDIAARTALICQGYDVMYSYRHRPIGDPRDGFKLSLGQMLLNVIASPNQGQMGIIRWFAHSIRAVAEARIAFDGAHELFDSWLRMAIRTVYHGQCLNGAWGDNHFGQQHEQEQPWTVPQPGYPLLGLRDGEMPAFQGPYMFCALDRAAEALKEPEYDALVETCLQRYLSIYEHCAREPGKYSAGTSGLPYWIRTSIDGKLLERCDRGGIGKSDPTWEPDVRRVAEKRKLVVPEFRR